MIDTHAHLDDKRYDSDRDAVINNIFNSGISTVINIGADMRGSIKSVELAERFENIYASVGIHPHYAKEMTYNDIIKLRKLAQNNKVVAIGEAGLDYYYGKENKEHQKIWFVEQIKLAKELNLPLVIHNRDAHKDCMDILKANNATKGVMHCFSGSAEMARIITEMGLYVAFGGVVTFKNAANAAVREVADEYLLLETDCPYLSPEPYRGQRNDSSRIPVIAARIAELRGVSVEYIEELTDANAKRLFGIGG